MSHSARERLLIQPRLAAAVLGLATLAVAGACSSDSAGPQAGNANHLAFGASTTVTTGASLATTPLTPITIGGNTINFTQVTLDLSRAELKPQQGVMCADESNDHDDDDDGADTPPSTTSNDCANVKVGAFSVDLPVDGSLVQLPADALPAGTYREIEVRLSDVHVVGTFNGTPFDVTLPVHMRGEVPLSTPLVVTEGTATSVTVDVPFDLWFINSDGTLLDPNTIAGDTNLMQVVRNRIRASFRAFEDRDHDNHDDHGGHGDGNH
jgi:hypothetical protein